MEIVPLKKEHWPTVEEIYLDGIATGQATFETSSPGWKKWNSLHLSFCRFVALDNKRVVGWTALLPVSTREVYKGVAEESTYISSKFWGQGIGHALLSHLINQSSGFGIYSLQAVMFPENKATVRLHEKCGFRKIGIKENISKLNDQWRDTVLYERRSSLFH